jgi:hypothetical protein
METVTEPFFWRLGNSHYLTALFARSRCQGCHNRYRLTKVRWLTPSGRMGPRTGTFPSGVFFPLPRALEFLIDMMCQIGYMYIMIDNHVPPLPSHPTVMVRARGSALYIIYGRVSFVSFAANAVTTGHVLL